jgi:nucleotidyltransferase/DNA polymerase involved in DNA repair
MMNFLRKNTLKVEPFSIDEAFCEITGLAELYKLSLEDYIKKLKSEIIKYI